jgi:GNAT superfamily N-acetyltransferase
MPSDIPALCALLDALFSIEVDFQPNPARQKRGLALLLERGDAACVLVAEQAGVVVGMCTAQVLISTAEGGPVAWVEDVVISAEMRGQGLGSRLLQAMEEWARERGVLRLQLLADCSNRPALRFYAGRGWHATQLTAWHKRPRNWHRRETD